MIVFRLIWRLRRYNLSLTIVRKNSSWTVHFLAQTNDLGRMYHNIRRIPINKPELTGTTNCRWVNVWGKSQNFWYCNCNTIFIFWIFYSECLRDNRADDVMFSDQYRHPRAWEVWYRLIKEQFTATIFRTVMSYDTGSDNLIRLAMKQSVGGLIYWLIDYITNQSIKLLRVRLIDWLIGYGLDLY
jgi:hypothetical protein